MGYISVSSAPLPKADLFTVDKLISSVTCVVANVVALFAASVFRRMLLTSVADGVSDCSSAELGRLMVKDSVLVCVVVVMGIY